MLFAVLFNLGGYSLFFQYMINRSDYSIIDRINNNHYQHSDLVEVKVPVDMPTQQDWDTYQVVSGQVEVKDVSYDYAEIKITRDTLYLRVVPNHDRTKLINANNTYAKLANDIPLTKKSQNLLVKKSISDSEYHYRTVNYKAAVSVNHIGTYGDHAFLNPIKSFLDVPGQPPDASPVLFS